MTTPTGQKARMLAGELYLASDPESPRTCAPRRFWRGSTPLRRTPAKNGTPC